ARHARRLHEVRRADERPGQRVGRVDEPQVAAPRLLDAGGDAGQLEPPWGPHGHTPSRRSPAVSGKPCATLKACTAWPAAPLPRLSMAQNASTCPLRGSKRAESTALSLPLT